MNVTTTPAQQDKKTGRTVAIAVASVLAAAGIATGLVFGLSGNAPTPPAESAAASVPAAPAAHHSVAPIEPVTPAKPVTPPVAPSAAIKTLQQELGQLNYYEGPVTGIMNTQTTQAITYLQRDAGIAQTGTMNTATQAALAHFLATGNNQMAG
jgi:peptidoglycan hydrolase-like protein with peptidoglycan-binding domain